MLTEIQLHEVNIRQWKEEKQDAFNAKDLELSFPMALKPWDVFDFTYIHKILAL